MPIDSPIKDVPIVFSLNELFPLPVGEVWKIWKTESYDVPILAYSLCKKSITCVVPKGELFAKLDSIFVLAKRSGLELSNYNLQSFGMLYFYVRMISYRQAQLPLGRAEINHLLSIGQMMYCFYKLHCFHQQHTVK